MTDISDKEQIEMIKDWWKNNGKFTIVSIIAVMLFSFGWRYWQNYKEKQSILAASAYMQVLGHQSNQQYSDVEFDVTYLMTHYPHTPYATLAAFISAKNALQKNTPEAAIEKLNWVIKNSKNDDFRQIAKIRKARILLSARKYDGALEAIADIKEPLYLPLVNEVRGDIFAAMKNKKEALSAYQNALNTLPKEAPNRHFLQMKYQQLND